MKIAGDKSKLDAVLKKKDEEKIEWLSKPFNSEAVSSYQLGWKSTETGKSEELLLAKCSPVCVCNTGGYCVCVSQCGCVSEPKCRKNEWC